MALLGNRYLKEGPGVYADDLPKSAAAQFFAILGRKFWAIIRLNLMYLLFSLPAIALTFLIAPFLLGNLFPGLSVDGITDYLIRSGIAGSMGEGITLQNYASVILFAMFTSVTVFMVSMSLAVLGPVHAGMTFVLRNFAQEQHAFLWSDFWEHAKKNLGQSLGASAIGLVGTVILAVGLGVYMTIVGSSVVKILIVGLFALFFLVLMVMQMYVYPIMVTFKLPLKHIYKNAFLFFSLNLFTNIGIILIGVAMTVILPIVLILLLNQVGLFLYVLYFLFIGFGAQFLLVNFYVYRQIDRHMIQRILEKKPEDDAASEGSTEG